MVEIFAKIPFEDVVLYDKLKEKGYKIELLLGRMEITFDSREEIVDIITSDLLPKKAFFLFRVYESGGGKTNTGFSQIVCDFNGKPLKPRKVYTNGHLANRSHAMFECSEAILITSTKNGTISITYGKIIPEIGIFSSSVLWSGPIEWFPESFIQYKKAVDAAYKKANCYHCRHCHYRT